MQTWKARVVFEGSPYGDNCVVSIPVRSEVLRLATSLHEAAKPDRQKLREWDIEYDLASPDEGIPDMFWIHSILKMPDAWPPDDPFSWIIPMPGVWRIGVAWVEDDPEPRISEHFENLVPIDAVVQESLSEGAVTRYEGLGYERSQEARRRCLAFYGTRCTACSMDFGDTYGPVADGYIHIHHLDPISSIGQEHEVDPIKDLRPLCPNCHAVAHLRVPPHSIEELKSFLQPSEPRNP
jgi:HNH endonuclease